MAIGLGYGTFFLYLKTPSTDGLKKSKAKKEIKKKTNILYAAQIF
jgi:hypothetical protein